jgi:hypothetical protein
LGAVKLLLDLVLRAELAAPPPRRPAARHRRRRPARLPAARTQPPRRRPGDRGGWRDGTGRHQRQRHIAPMTMGFAPLNPSYWLATVSVEQARQSRFNFWFGSPLGQQGRKARKRASVHDARCRNPRTL